MATFTSGATIDKVLDKLRKHLNENADDLRRAFQLIDKDRSNQISTDEFVEVLREMKIVLPPSTLLGLIERFDLNGDGTISIPEFMAFMSGDSDRMEVLASAAAVGPSISDRPAPAPEPDLHSIAERRLFGASNSGPLQISASETAFQFLSRMQGDIEERRRTAFINEISAWRSTLACLRLASLGTLLIHPFVHSLRAHGRKGPALRALDA